jgi:putative ABC transport system permease protein
MPRASALPLAWRKLVHEKPRLLLSAAGISFAAVLMYAEVGFLHGMYDSQIQLLDQLEADVFLTSRARYAMLIGDTFPRRRLAQARGVEGVAAAYPLYVEIDKPLWRNPDNGIRQLIRVVAFNPDDQVFRMAEIRAARGRLKEPDTVLFDVKSRPSYGRCTDGVQTELSGRVVSVVGTFAIGTDFLSDGNVITSDKTYLKIFGSRAGPDTQTGRRDTPVSPGEAREPRLLENVHLGLVQLVPGSDPEGVATALRAALPDDVVVQTRQQFLAQEMGYWQEFTPLGFIFGLGAALGFVVGVIICYQILFTDVVDHLPQFATLKAIGYADRFLVQVVLTEALFLSLLGFLPGFLLSLVGYRVAAALTGLPMQLTIGRVALVFVLTVAMCMVSGLLAIRKVLQADPAEVF